MSKSSAGTESQPHLYPTALPLSLERPGTQQTACCPACSIPQAQVWSNQELEPTAVDHNIEHVPGLGQILLHQSPCFTLQTQNCFASSSGQPWSMLFNEWELPILVYKSVTLPWSLSLHSKWNGAKKIKQNSSSISPLCQLLRLLALQKFI